MRYTTLELEYTDVLWFGVNQKHAVAAFTSGGTACVPEFVRQSKEETEQLEDFFLRQLPASTQCSFCSRDDANAWIPECRRFAEKGLYCFDRSERLGIDYELMTRPQVPLRLEQLPPHIAALLQSHLLDVDFTHADTVVLGG